MLAMTPNAVLAARSAMADGEGTEAGLRVAVQSGGCAGLRYAMGFEPAPQDDDTVVDCQGLKVFVDPASALLLDGVTIDFVTRLEGAGFTFDNPKAQGKCGCGKSFAC
ncbi:MAG: iron-sulfur cluster assembly accessory protein [Magnetospirillum sp. WYHS-4]